LTKSNSRDVDLAVVSVASEFSATALEEALSVMMLPETDGFGAACSDRSAAEVNWSPTIVSSLTIIQLSISAGCVVSDDDRTCLSADFIEDLPAFTASAL